MPRRCPATRWTRSIRPGDPSRTVPSASKADAYADQTIAGNPVFRNHAETAVCEPARFPGRLVAGRRRSVSRPRLGRRQTGGDFEKPFSTTTEKVTPFNDVTHYNNYYE